MIRLMTKPTKWSVRPAKTQISLGICPVWSESSQCAQWVAEDRMLHHADSEDSDQTGRMPRLGANVILLVLSRGGSTVKYLYSATCKIHRRQRFLYYYSFCKSAKTNRLGKIYRWNAMQSNSISRSTHQTGNEHGGSRGRVVKVFNLKRSKSVVISPLWVRT